MLCSMFRAFLLNITRLSEVFVVISQRQQTGNAVGGALHEREADEHKQVIAAAVSFIPECPPFFFLAVRFR